MTLTDLERTIQELNELILTRKIVDAKTALQICKDANGMMNSVDIGEAVVRLTAEQAEADLYLYNKEAHKNMRSIWEANMSLPEWFATQHALRERQNKLMARLVEKICETPTPLKAVMELAQQWGAHYIDSIFDVVAVMADVVRQAPPKVSYAIHSGPRGQVYILIPKPGWTVSRTEPATWRYTSEDVRESVHGDGVTA
jgi:hypothetical protein